LEGSVDELRDDGAGDDLGTKDMVKLTTKIDLSVILRLLFSRESPSRVSVASWSWPRRELFAA